MLVELLTNKARTACITHNNMAQGLTLEQLQTMGATPVSAPTVSSSQPQGLTLAQLQKMGATPTGTAQVPSTPITEGNTTGDSFVSGLVKSPIQSLLVNPAIRTAQALSAGIGYATNNKSLEDNADAGQTFDIPILGKYYVPGQEGGLEGGKQIAGQAAEAGAYLIPAGEIGGVVSDIAKGALSKAVVSGATQGAIGGALGSGGSEAMQEGSTPTQIAESTGTGALVGGISGGFLAGGGAAVANGVSAIKDPIASAVDSAANIVQGASKLGIAEKNVPGNFAASVDRLSESPTPQPETLNPIGASVDNLTQPPPGGTISDMQSPLALYDKYYAQSLKSNTDVKEDSPLEQIGTEELAPAIDKIVALKRAAGQLMGSEMQKVGDTPTDISATFLPFEQELQANGLGFNADEGKLIPTTASKMTAQDRGVLQSYVNDLNQLGTTPTARELDAFTSRIPEELKVYKNQNNITGMTNAERLINNNLHELKNSLSSNPEIGGNPVFADYAKAKSNYAALSQFLDNGESFVGKKTTSGDFAKDSSLLKSSVQSLLNNGKKDWLLKLEQITGNPILDKASLALQAMKDAGDYRAESLLDLLSPNSPSDIPTSKEGVINKVLDVGFKMGKKAYVGTPNEQTRLFIRSRMNAGLKAVPR